MGQHWSQINSKIVDKTNENKNDPAVISDTSLFDNDQVDIALLLSLINSTSTSTNSVANSEKQHLKHIQHHLSQLTNTVASQEINSEIHEILLNEIFSDIVSKRYQEAELEVGNILTKQIQLQKLACDSNIDQSIFAQPFIDPSCIDSEDSDDRDQDEKLVKQKQRKAEFQTRQVSYFAIQSLTSILLILIKSAEKTDPAIVQAILTSTNQLCQQMPMKCLTLSNTTPWSGTFLIKALRPLTDYINELSLANESMIAKQALQIQLSFAIAKGSLKDLLNILSKLIFDSVNIYPVQGLFVQLNDSLTEAITSKKKPETDSKETTDPVKSTSLEYLKSIGVYPSTKLMKLNEKQFTGQWISSVILAHIDFDQEIHSIEPTSMLFDFHPDILKQLLHMIEQLSVVITTSERSPIHCFLRIICIRLLTAHLYFLCALKSTIVRDLFSKSNLWKETVIWNTFKSQQCDIDSTSFVDDTKLKTLFDLLLEFASDDDDKAEQATLCKESSKALIYLLHKTTLSFSEKLSFIHKSIFENKHRVLTEQLWLELNKKATILCWIEVLCDGNVSDSEKATALSILYSFLDAYWNPPNGFEDEQKQRIGNLLLLFQDFLLCRVIQHSDKNEKDGSVPTNIPAISSLVINYVTQIFNARTEKVNIFTQLLNSILLGLSTLIEKQDCIDTDILQPIFVATLPLLADYLLQTTSTNDEHVKTNLHSLAWLIGRMSHFLITSPSENALEKKHADKLNSLLFTNGCEQILAEKSPYLLYLFQSNLAVYSKFMSIDPQQLVSSDKEFLMSIYNNTDHGAKLISKMKMHLKDKQRPLQKSIEQLVSEACAALFAVYIKHYRRTTLARSELSRPDDQKPHHKLLTLFEYANGVYTIFTQIKGQGGDCHVLCQQIRANALFLLLSVKENHRIPMINEDVSKTTTQVQLTKVTKLTRTDSQWRKAKVIFRMLRNTMQACIRLKKLMISRKQMSEEKQDYESLLNRLIDTYVYGDLSRTTMSNITSEEKKLESEQLVQCMSRQYQRAMTRLLTYRFSELFIEKVLNCKDERRVQIILAIYLPSLVQTNFETSYLENIQGSDEQLKHDIGNRYYSCIHIVLSTLLRSTAFESIIFAKPLFNLLNLSYQSVDLCHLDRYGLVETLFTSMVSFVQKTSDKVNSLEQKLIAYNWFRLFVLKLCENIQMEKSEGSVNPLLQQQRDFVFNTLIFNELKQLKESVANCADEGKSDDSIPEKNEALNNITFGWFAKAIGNADRLTLSSRFDIELWTNQWLILLLRCLHFYEHVRSVCATMDHIEEFVDIYHHSHHRGTQLLALKILRYLIPFLSNNSTETSQTRIQNQLDKLLSIIDSSSYSNQLPTADTVPELIFLYRKIVSCRSPCQSLAAQLIFDSIKLKFNDWESFKLLDKNQLNHFSAALCVLGGYIQPYCLGSIVKINDETLTLAVITKIDKKARDSASSNKLPYLIQYSETKDPQWVSVDKLELIIDVPAPNLLLLSNGHDPHVVLDQLAYFLQMDTSTNESLVLLQLKRRCMVALYHLLQYKTTLEIFMENSYASAIAELCLSKRRPLPSDLRQFNKLHLEQYCLSLNFYEEANSHVEKEQHNAFSHDAMTKSSTNLTSENLWSEFPINGDPLIKNDLSLNASYASGWKAKVSEKEMEVYRKGRVGANEISLAPMPEDIANPEVLETCGTNHEFLGRIHATSESVHVSFPTFIVNNLRLTEGKWYYCVKLPMGGLVQIGWATDGFTPEGHSGRGVGDDGYSWSYDGSRHVLFHDGAYAFPSEDIYWQVNDVCGCGIEINGNNTQIKYWLNGKLLGTAFAHESAAESATAKCNMMVNDPETSFFPAVSVQNQSYGSFSCELIFSPEDMIECPLPEDYKPLLAPELVQFESFFVAYPYSAYLIGDDIHDYLQSSRKTISTTLLRDFVNKHHLETQFPIDDHHLMLPADSDGFPLIIDDLASLLTISFDFKLATEVETTAVDSTRNILLLIFDMKGALSVQITLPKTVEETRTVIVFDPKEGQAKVYLNNKYRIFQGQMNKLSTTKLSLNILPNIAVGIRNLAVWKYSLPEEHIQRLFTRGLSHVAVDYQQLREYRHQANMFIFKQDQQEFASEILVPMNEPFEEELWQKRKTYADNDESNCFKFEELAAQLFGNQSYLVLDKSTQPWSAYTIVLDICIGSYPIKSEHLTLIGWRPQSNICITDDGRLCLLNNTTAIKRSETTLILNQYVRLIVSVQEKSMKVYMNGMLMLDVIVEDDQLIANLNRIELFRETDLTMNTTSNETVRIKCKSIAFRNGSKAVSEIAEQMQSPDSSLETWIALPFEKVVSSLKAIGYREVWIKAVMQQSKTSNIQLLDTLIRTQKDDLVKADLDNERKDNLNVLSKIAPSIDKDRLEDLMMFAKFDSEKEMGAVADIILFNWNDLRTENLSTDADHTDENESSEDKLFRQAVRGLSGEKNFAEWIRGKSKSKESETIIDQLLDLSHPEKEQTTMIQLIESPRRKLHKSIQYSHQKKSPKEYLDSRIACEHGLITIYARYTVFNMLNVWSIDGSSLFPLEKLGNSAFILRLLRLMDYHYTYTGTDAKEKIDRLSLFIKPRLKIETKQLLEYTSAGSQITKTTLEFKAPLIYRLQKDLIIQSIRFLVKPSLLLNVSDENSTTVDEGTIVEQSSLRFLLKIMNLFVELVNDKSSWNEHEMESIVAVLFPESLINLMFDLFLVVPKHQSKLIILHFLVTLMQASDSFNLNEQMLQFLYQLLVQISTDKELANKPTPKKFQIILMDFVYLHSNRQKKRQMSSITTSSSNEEQSGRLQLVLAECSQNVRDVLIVFDVLQALNDKSKQTRLPETFLAQSNALLGENLSFTADDFEKSNSYFDTTTDQQLMQFMNKHLLADGLFNDFILSLPVELAPNTTFYKIYPFLSTIPAICVRTRAKLVYQFNLLIEKALSLVDLSLAPGQRILTDRIRSARAYILYSKKFELFDEFLSKTSNGYTGEAHTIQFDTVQATADDDNGENTMFNQAYQQLHSNAHKLFRNEDDRLWYAAYVGMHSIDAGGPFRDSITRMCSDICSVRLPLFILCPNGRTNSGLNRDRWIPNVFPPETSIPVTRQNHYRFIGQLMGLAIRRKHYLDLKFPLLLWKQLAKEEVTIEDIEAIDIQSFTIIKEMETSMEQNQMIDADINVDYFFSSVMSELRFDVVSSAGQTYELIPGGKEIPITAANFKEYCTRYRHYRLNEFHRQIDCIRQGLYSVVPSYFLSLFTADELEEAVCGTGEIDVELLKRNTYYSSSSQDTPHIQRFWTVLSEMFNEKQKKSFIAFVWGRSTLPRREEDFKSKFCINDYYTSSDDVDKTLPRSHTCSFALDLPAYTTTEIMYERLNYAITYCSSIDGDG